MYVPQGKALKSKTSKKLEGRGSQKLSAVVTLSKTPVKRIISVWTYTITRFK
jgi:hypothetical protein